MKKIVFLGIVLVAFLLTSCKKDNCLQAIPDNVTALMAVDLEKAGLPVDASFIDQKQKVYLFEMADGMLGMAAQCNENGEGFKVMDDKWVCGFDGGRMLVLGPVLPAQHEATKHRITALLEQSDEESIEGTPMLERLDSIDAPLALVAQAKALPEQFVALFTIGAPQNAEPSQVYIAARMTLKDGVLRIDGHNFSLNKSLDAYLQKANAVFHPLAGQFDQEADQGIFSLKMNVKGGELLPLMQQNQGLQALLAGMNTAIDMNKILNAVDGDLALMLKGANLDMEMKAQLANTDFVQDIAYWKSSCPKGSRIEDKGPGQWLFVGGDADFLFSVNGEKEFTGRLTHRTSTDNDIISSALAMLRPFVGDLKAIVYTVGQ